jgi:hypothetical protein
MAAIAASLSISRGATVTEPRQTSPRVHLGYASYEGTTLENGVQQFLGMRYAAPPLGENRFRRAQDPFNETHVVSATKASGRPISKIACGLTFISMAQYAMVSRA